jgi:decaprenylphospho-beta-D-ribofuranose 2-oxidase
MPLTEAVAVSATSGTVRGWGGGAPANALILRPTDVDEAQAAVAQSRSARRGAIARGMGRSYGDAAQLSGGHLLETARLRGFELDDDAGMVTAQTGVTVGELIAALVPAGWMLPVVPGTQHVSVGGAIASDVHGKNHPTAGSFGATVRALGLLTADGEVREIGPGSEPQLFAATVGGMGLTGLVLWARLELERVPGPMMSVDTDRARGLDEAFALLAAPGSQRHRVAWLDLLGPRAGRAVVTRSEHAASAGAATDARRATVRAAATVPERWPSGALRPSAVRAYNELRYRRAPRRERGRPQGLGAHLFPLDALAAWPRLYGSAGLLQYQFAVPSGAERAIEAVIERLAVARVPCFLAVLKRLGAASSAPLSFPVEGWTLALDLPRAAAGAEAALDGCDELVAEAGGRVYLTKDARLGPAALSAMYPRLQEWRAARDAVDPEGLWRSDLSVRTGLISEASR